jgi:hypothetical protein
MADTKGAAKWNREETIVISIDVGTTQSEFIVLCCERCILTDLRRRIICVLLPQ